MEKVIKELRVIETDDGFRIEIKGDKEKIRSFISGFGDPKRWHHWQSRRPRGHWGPFGFRFGPWMGMKEGFCWGPWGFGEEGEAEETSEA